MATTIIKSWNSDNQAEVTADHELKITGDISATNPSVGPSGDPAPTSGTLAAGVDPNGNLQPLKVDADGKLIVTGSSETNGFAILAPGYPTQMSVGTTSIQIFPANLLRKYAHIMNNSNEAIYIQYSSSAALNQGIKIGPGSFFTLEIDNLWLGVINGIGLMSGQLIDILEGE